MSERAQTVGEALGLDQADPWSKGKPYQQRDTSNRGETQFVDPPDDENLTFEGKDRVYSRFEFAGQKLSQIIALEPSLRSVAFAGGNRASGCWVVVNSSRIASRLSRRFQELSVPVSITLVGCDGQPVLPDREIDLDAVEAGLSSRTAS